MLLLHRSERSDLLVHALAEVLADPLEDSIEAEVVAVPTRGIERWLTQRLSHRLGAGPAGGGICANLTFPFPGHLVDAVTARATGLEPAADPWRPERAVWPLVDLIDGHIAAPELAALADHLRAATPPGRDGSDRPPRRFAVARHIADLFDRYAVQRTGMILEWSGAPAADVEAAGGPGPRPEPDTGWQPHLWRLLRRRLDVPSPAERLAAAAAAIAADPESVRLPQRLSVFGLTRLPDSHLRVLAAAATHRDVHLFLLHPSVALWERVAAAAPRPRPGLRRADDPTDRLARHPLLRSWGRDAREMQLVLAGRGVEGGWSRPVAPTGRPATLLSRLQDDIRADRPPSPPAGGEPRDLSVQVHACHGRSRQIEVLRDTLLHLFAGDASLEARHVIVMCPDIEAFAPLIHATFGSAAATASGPHGEPVEGRLRVRLADRALLQTNPLLSVAGRLLELAGSRLTASEVLDLASRPAVARRFAFGAEDLALIERWVAGSGVRWGIDAEHRRPWGLNRVASNTWAAGLDRLLLGIAMAGDRSALFEGTAPYEAAGSADADLLGRLAEMVSRLDGALARLVDPKPVGGWARALIDAVDLLAAADPDEPWQLPELRRTLDEAERESLPAAGAPSEAGGANLSAEEVRSFLSGRLQGRPTRANFATGDITFCTLVPMRSVPHRVVALVGLDDGAFPRQPHRDGDNILLGDPRVGDREARAEDRQMLLDAVLAAGDHLLITYSGRDERTNRGRPPCAPVAELLDVLDAMSPVPVRDELVVHHPLQPFDRRNFTPGSLGRPGPFCFDRVQLAGALAAADQAPEPPWLPEALPPLEEPVLALDHLVSFAQAPVRSFLRRRLSLYLSDSGDDPADAIPLELGPLERWAVGDRLLEAVLAGVPLDQAVQVEVARGLLPPQPLGAGLLDDLAAGVAQLAAEVDRLGVGPGPAHAAEVRVGLGEGRELFGAVGGLRGDTVVQCVFSRLGPKHRLAAWVRLLALTASRPDRSFSAVTIGRSSGRSIVRVSTLTPPAEAAADRAGWARDRLAELEELYRIGMASPLPMACNTSAAWAASRRAGGDEEQAMRACESEWSTTGLVPKERDLADHAMVFGRFAPLSRLLADRPSPAERGPGWPVESTRFAVLARRLWDPLLSSERLASP